MFKRKGIDYKIRLSNYDKHRTIQQSNKIIVMSEVSSIKLDSEEIFEEIVGLLYCYSMKLYSKRKGQKIKEILKD